MIANPLRNEHTVVLNDNNYFLRATFNTLVEIETLVGKPLTKIMDEIGNGNLNVGHIKGILVAGSKGAEVNLDEKQLEEDICAAGIVEATAAAVDFLLVATIGGEKIKKNYAANLEANLKQTTT